MATKSLTQERLKELLRYDPETGKFCWAVSPRANIKVGAEAGTSDAHGYVIISIDRRLYRAHRLAWLWVYGEWPSSEIDHINRTPSDNRIANLRLADRFLNTQNVGIRSDNTSGHRGVGFHKISGKWRARYQLNKRNVDLGYFPTKEAAVTAYLSAINATADL